MTDRKFSLISKELATVLLTQLAHELKNYNLYMSFANYFSTEALIDLECYYKHRADEELQHHKWIMDYLSEADIKFTYPAIEENVESFFDYDTPFVQTVEREILTTKMIYDIYAQAEIDKDYMTCSWLYKLLIPEQIEEENISRMARKIMEEEHPDIFIKAKKVLELIRGK